MTEAIRIHPFALGQKETDLDLVIYDSSRGRVSQREGTYVVSVTDSSDPRL